MKGIIFDLLEQVVVAHHGQQTWESLLERTGLSGAYTTVGSYDDEELIALVYAASDALETEQDALVRWFGRECIPLMVDRYAAFFDHPDTRSFLLTLNDVIHPEVRKLFPGAYAPSFDFVQPVEGTLRLAYESHRRLCSFAEGLVEGAADHFGERVTITQPMCAKRGDERCVLEAEFVSA